MAALGHHHRVEHDGAGEPRQRLRHGHGDLGIGNHADFDRVNVDIVEHQPDLLIDELSRHNVDAGDTLRVLRRQRGDCRHSIDAARRERLQIRLDARAA
ncbi:hypothetical protein SAMN04488026_100242 [Aliiruegeria lutimaris]|uniref:Uncharacterized protein n=1 Tax=Aliiruegeria lutimaris TaxID=571298 RepID=A0A1G8JR72_9RHOB|nr:hypothetical protein SAMN04488026_100242 [Aliiruegeria lutimaris]